MVVAGLAASIVFAVVAFVFSWIAAEMISSHDPAYAPERKVTSTSLATRARWVRIASGVTLVLTVLSAVMLAVITTTSSPVLLIVAGAAIGASLGFAAYSAVLRVAGFHSSGTTWLAVAFYWISASITAAKLWFTLAG